MSWINLLDRSALEAPADAVAAIPALESRDLEAVGYCGLTGGQDQDTRSEKPAEGSPGWAIFLAETNLPHAPVWLRLGAWDFFDRSALEPATDAVAAIPALERRDAAPVPPVHHPVPPDISGFKILEFKHGLKI